MKQMTCAQMGGSMTGTCQTMIQGTTVEEIVKAGGDHVMATDPEIAEKMRAMTPEQNASWMADFKPKFDAMPEMA